MLWEDQFFLTSSVLVLETEYSKKMLILFPNFYNLLSTCQVAVVLEDSFDIF